MTSDGGLLVRTVYRHLLRATKRLDETVTTRGGSLQAREVDKLRRFMPPVTASHEDDVSSLQSQNHEHESVVAAVKAAFRRGRVTGSADSERMIQAMRRVNDRVVEVT